jgi:hypothetical protein
MRWLDNYGETVAAQLKTRSSLGPNSIGAVEATLRQDPPAPSGGVPFTVHSKMFWPPGAATGIKAGSQRLSQGPTPSASVTKACAYGRGRIGSQRCISRS